MNTPVLTAGQVEFAEIFERLEREFKMSRAEVARALHIERSYVTMLINGQRTPRLRTLEDMRDLEKRMQAERAPEGTAADSSELNRLFNQLKTLEQTDRERFQAARQMVDALAQASTNSKPASAASKLLRSAAASVRKPVSK